MSNSPYWFYTWWFIWEATKLELLPYLAIYLMHLLTNLLCSLILCFPSQQAYHCWSGKLRQKLVPVCVVVLRVFLHLLTCTSSFWDHFFPRIHNFQHKLFFLECQDPSFPNLNSLCAELQCMVSLLTLCYDSLLTGGFRMCHFCLAQIL